MIRNMTLKKRHFLKGLVKLRHPTKTMEILAEKKAIFRK